MPQAVSIPISPISATRRGALRFGGIAAIAGLLKPTMASLVLDPLNVEWFEIQERLYGIGGPRTPEGAIAAAFAALAEAPRDLDGVIECPDLATWLSIRCVEFILAGEVPA